MKSSLHGCVKDGIDWVKLLGGREDGIGVISKTWPRVLIGGVKRSACNVVIGCVKNG